MKKRGVIAAVSVAVLAMGVSTSQARDLTVVGWGGTAQDAMRKVYFEPFRKQTGIPVTEDSWGGGYGVLQSKTQSGEPNWDLVLVEEEELLLGCQDGVLEPLNWATIGNRDEFVAEAATECGAGSYIWSTIMAYNGDTYKEDPPDSWADFWNVEKYPGRRALRKGAKYNLEFALMADGVSRDKVYEVLATPEGVDRAFAKLEELKPHIVWWESGNQPAQLLVSGDVVLATAYNPRITTLNLEEGRNLQIVWNDSIYAIDSWAVLKGSPFVDEVNRMIGFMSAYEQQVEIPRYFTNGLTNARAAKNVAPELEAYLPTSPANYTVARKIDSTFWIDNLESLTERFNAWLAQ